MTTNHSTHRLPVLLALSVALVAGCSNGKAKDKDPAEADAAVPVEVQPLRRAAILAVYSGTAPIEAHEEAAEIFTWSAAVALLLFAAALFLPGEALAQKLAMAATAASLVVLFLGYRAGQGGGSLVYEHGAASAYGSAAGGGGQAPATFADTDDD